MKMIAFYIFVIILSMTKTIVYGHLNVFISQPEVMKLLGLNAELYYVRDGVVNTYAMNFVVPVSAYISDLEFSWQSLTKQPLPYVMSIMYDSQGALLPPRVNISERGSVPVTVETFRVQLPCTGLRSAEIEVRLQLNITAVNRMHEDTWLNIRRNKICLKGYPPLPPRNDTVTLAADSLVTSGGTFYIAAGSALAMISIIVAGVSTLYIKSKKSRNHDSIHTSYTTAAYGSHGNVFIRLDAMGRPASAGSGSYATIASIHKFPLGSRRSPSPYATTQIGNHIYAKPEPPAYFSTANSYCASENHTTLSQISWCSDNVEKLRKLVIQRSAIFLGPSLQEGTFGRLFRGELKQGTSHKTVLVKTVSDAASKNQASLMVTEGSLMAGMVHDNILSPLAAVIPQELSAVSPLTRPLLVYPYCSHGNLKKFLLERRSSSIGFDGESGTVATPMASHLITMATGAARGLVYLHARRITHRDVSARNCVVDEKMQVKITDNALSRDLFPCDYHCLGDNENRPIKWMALEALQYNQFSPASDVWSFGIFLWELVTLAQEPYAEVDPFEIAAFLRDGYRLTQPVNCPDELYTVMSCCWLAAVDARPTLVQLLAFLQDFQTALAQYI